MVMRPMLQFQLASQKKNPASQKQTELLSLPPLSQQPKGGGEQRGLLTQHSQDHVAWTSKVTTHWWAIRVVFLHQCTAETQNEEHAENQSCSDSQRGSSAKSFLFQIWVKLREQLQFWKVNNSYFCFQICNFGHIFEVRFIHWWNYLLIIHLEG